MLNGYEKANIQAIESLENSMDQNTTSSAVPSEFSFADIDGVDFIYASGVGAWGTTLTIYTDGTFSGEYSNWSIGAADETHPRGEYEYCEFTGNFSEPTKIDDYTYSATVEYINQTYETGISEIKDEVLYNYTDPVGIGVGDEFMFYLPGTPIEELPDSYVSWKYSTSNPPASLPSNGLYNASEAAVFG